MSTTQTQTRPYTDEDVARIVARVKDEVLKDIADGTVPEDVADFSTLHDFVDANTYGGLADYENDPTTDPVVKALWAAHWAGEEDLDFSDSPIFAFASAVQDKVHEWLKAGRPVCKESAHSFCETHSSPWTPLAPECDGANLPRPSRLDVRTDELVPGDVIIHREIDSRSYLLPLSDEHPGHRLTVLGVAPWVLTAGPHKGEVKTDGRRQGNGRPLWRITITTDDTRWEGQPVAAADEVWTVER